MTAREATRLGRKEVAGLVFLGLAFVGAGAFLLSLFAGTLADHRRAAGWERVLVRIREAGLVVKKDEQEDGTSYLVEASYSYTYRGKAYGGTKVGPDPGASSSSRHRERFEILDRHRASGRPFLAWVNPAKPEESMLFRDLAGTSWGLLVAGLVFGGFGLGVWILLLYLWRAPARRRRELARHPGRPWRVDPRWAEGFTLKLRPGGQIAGAVIGGLLCVGMTAAMAWGMTKKQAPWWGPLAAAMFAAFGVAALASAVYWTIRAAKYPGARLVLEELPAVPGRVLRAALICPARVEALSAFRATLACRRTSWRGDDRKVETLCEQSRELPAGPDSARPEGGIRLALEMPVPEDQPETSAPDEIPSVSWTLAVSAATPGVDFHAEFPIPVFRVEDESLIERRPPGEDAG